MKQDIDLDLVREILIAVGEKNLTLNNLGHDRNQIYLHVKFMEEHGLVEAAIVLASDGDEYRILRRWVKRLTRKGGDFLDKARSKSIWEQAKRECLERTGGLAIEFLSVCLADVTKRHSGIG